VAGRGVADVGEKENFREGGAGLMGGGVVRVSAAKEALRGTGVPAEGDGMAGTGGGGVD
jgi:hypothetical protein